MKYIFYHYTSGDEHTVEAECEDQAWDGLQDHQETALDELHEQWYLGHVDDGNEELTYDQDDDEAEESCCE